MGFQECAGPFDRQGLEIAVVGTFKFGCADVYSRNISRLSLVFTLGHASMPLYNWNWSWIRAGIVVTRQDSGIRNWDWRSLGHRDFAYNINRIRQKSLPLSMMLIKRSPYLIYRRRKVHRCEGLGPLVCMYSTGSSSTVPWTVAPDKPRGIGWPERLTKVGRYCLFGENFLP